MKTSKDLIERQALMKELSDFVRASNNSDFVRTPTWNDAVSLVGSMPSAQPQIIHCAECIHWQHSAVRKSYCEVFDWMNDAEDFCSFAEGKQDDKNT